MTTYKYLSDSVVAKIDDDGLSRMSCTLEHPEYIAWLSEGNTPEPADPIIRDIKSEIAQLETQQMMPRVTREFMLTFTESAYTPEQLALNIGYTKLKAFDEEVKALRELL